MSNRLEVGQNCVTSWVRPFSLGAPLRLAVNLGTFIVLTATERVSLARVIRRDVPLSEGVG